MNIEETYRSNDKLIRKSLVEIMPDLTISPAVKLAIMEHVKKKKSHKFSVLLLVTGIAASLLLVFFLGRTSSPEKNLENMNPSQILTKKKVQKQLLDKCKTVNSNYTTITDVQLNNTLTNNLTSPIASLHHPQLNSDSVSTITTSNIIHDTIYIKLEPERSFDSVYLAMNEGLNKLEMEYRNARISSEVNMRDILPSHLYDEQFDTLSFDSIKKEMNIFEKEFLDARKTMIF